MAMGYCPCVELTIAEGMSGLEIEVKFLAALVLSTRWSGTNDDSLASPFPLGLLSSGHIIWICSPALNQLLPEWLWLYLSWYTVKLAFPFLSMQFTRQQTFLKQEKMISFGRGAVRQFSDATIFSQRYQAVQVKICLELSRSALILEPFLR